MAIFENVKNTRYRYQRLRLQLINLNYGSIEILRTYLPPVAVFCKVCFYAGITNPITRLLPIVAEVTQTPKSLENAFIFH